MKIIDKLTAKYVNFNENTPLITIPSIVTPDEWAELYSALKYTNGPPRKDAMEFHIEQSEYCNCGKLLESCNEKYTHITQGF